MIVGIIYDEQVKADILVLMDNLTSDTKTIQQPLRFQKDINILTHLNRIEC